MRKIKSFDDAKVNYDIKRLKSDYFLVFIHGAGGNLTAWKKERQYFHKKGISTLAIDLRGHGLSGRPRQLSDYGLDNFAKDLHAILEKEKIRNFILIAHCFGGMIAMKFEELYPNLAKAFVFVDTAAKAPHRLRAFMFFNSPILPILNFILKNRLMTKTDLEHCNYKKFINSGDWNLRRMYADISHTSLRSWIFTYQNLAHFDGREVLKKINVPALIIHGEKDRIFDAAEAKEINDLIHESTLDILPGTSHVIVLNDPDILCERIYNFIESDRVKVYKVTK